MYLNILKKTLNAKNYEYDTAGVYYTCDDVCIFKRKQHFKGYNGAG